MVLLLRRNELSEADALDAAEDDRRWQLVLGTPGLEQALFGQGSLVWFRTHVIAYDSTSVDRAVELPKQMGGFGWKQVRVGLDSFRYRAPVASTSHGT